jgi:GT2 family glycosyltransferase
MKSILAVIVLYKMTASRSSAYRSLQQALQDSHVAREAIELVICDNTPSEEGAQKPIAPHDFQGVYRRNPTNPGLAECYNFALSRALEDRLAWLLLLDQDTTLTREYLEEIVIQSERQLPDPTIVALVPKLVQNGFVQSPHLAPTFRHAKFDRTISGVSDRRLYAFNSGSVVRVGAIREAGGFPEEFWLDFLDHATFHTLQARGGKLFVLTSCLEHDLSTNGVERKDEISQKRYQNVLDAEHRFYKLYGSPQDKVFHRIRLLRGALGTLVKKRHPAEALQMFKAAVRT